MRLPNMKYGDGIVKGKQIKFGGLNMATSASDGDLCAMRNLTGDHAPLLASRQPRLLYRSLEDLSGLFSWDGLAWVDGSKFFFNGVERGQVVAGEKAFASLGDNIVIFPDKVYYNVNSHKFGSMEARWEGSYLNFSDGALYGEPALANMIQHNGVNWSEWFNAGDAVTIAGCSKLPTNNLSAIIRDIDGDKMYFYENTFSLTEGDSEYEESGDMSISRTVPELLFLCECENRLWGCSKTTIYATKLGDIFNWNVYDGLETDAWAVTPGSPGEFTGCVTYGGYPTFFKDENIYKVYGSVPSNFQLMGSATLGVAEGSHKSLAVAGETLFYLGRSGVIAYTGGIPQPVSAPFGTHRYKNAVAGSDGLKYYISMEDTQGGWGLFVFDTQTGLWHREDETHATYFARWGGNLFYANDIGEIWITGNIQDAPAGAEWEEMVSWEAEFADFTDENPNKKGLSKLQIRLELEEGASVQVWLMFDSDGVWHRVSQALGEGVKRSYYLPIVPRRADHYRLKLTGAGGCRVYSLTREYYSGSELRSRTGRN